MCPLTGVYGKGGSGKNTLIAWFMAKYFQKITKFVNFTLKIKNTIKIDSVKLFEIPETEEPQILIWDEAYTEMDNRDFMELRNKINSYLLFQARKNNMSIISISQLNILDLRWRNLEEKTIICEDRPIYTWNKNNGIFEDYKGDFHFIIGSTGFRPTQYTLKYEIAKKVFPLFKTKERILPRNFEEMKKQVLLQNPKELLEYVTTLTHEVYATGIKNITHDNVRLALLDIGKIKDFKYEPYVYIKLKQLLKENKK